MGFVPRCEGFEPHPRRLLPPHKTTLKKKNTIQTAYPGRSQTSHTEISLFLAETANFHRLPFPHFRSLSGAGAFKTEIENYTTRKSTTELILNTRNLSPLNFSFYLLRLRTSFIGEKNKIKKNTQKRDTLSKRNARSRHTRTHSSPF